MLRAYKLYQFLPQHQSFRFPTLQEPQEQAELPLSPALPCGF